MSQRLWQEGANDTLLLKDIEEIKCSFETADTETLQEEVHGAIKEHLDIE